MTGAMEKTPAAGSAVELVQRRGFPLLLLVLAIGTIGTRYATPTSLFWDENYHIPSAQKQIDGVMYMEPHPPLGKMLIALGEVALGANDGRDTSKLLLADHVTDAQLPPGYSFAGVRLASVASMIAAVMFAYAMLVLATGQRWLAFVFAALPALDNALVVHARAAMLEGIQLCFAMASLCLLAWAVRRPRVRLRHYAALGVLVGLTMAVKLNGAVLLLLAVALYLADQWAALRAAQWRGPALRMLAAVPAFCVPLVLVVTAIFYGQIATATRVIPGHTYNASPEYLAHLRDDTTWTPRGFTTGLRDHLRYMAGYSDGVPRLDVCKPGENGSHATQWPLGGKTINYRWSQEIVDGEPRVSYTYLVANPVTWLAVLGGMLLSFALIASRVVFGAVVTDPRSFGWIALSCALYLAYGIAILQIDRVMYLYHYFLPLMFGLLNLAMLWNYLFGNALSEGRWHARLNLAALLALAAAAFVHFAPFTYGSPLGRVEVEQRAWFDVWQLEPVR